MIVNPCFFIVGLLVATLIYQRTRSRRSPCTIVTVRRCFPRSGCAQPSAPAAATVTRVITCHFFSNVRHFFCSARDSGTGTRASFSTVDIGTAFASTGSGGEGAASSGTASRWLCVRFPMIAWPTALIDTCPTETLGLPPLRRRVRPSPGAVNVRTSLESPRSRLVEPANHRIGRTLAISPCSANGAPKCLIDGFSRKPDAVI